MDYADNFNPKPIKGAQFTTKDGRIAIVDDVQPDEGIVYVFGHYDGEAPFTFAHKKEEWETLFTDDDSINGNKDSSNGNPNEVGGDGDDNLNSDNSGNNSSDNGENDKGDMIPSNTKPNNDNNKKEPVDNSQDDIDDFVNDPILNKIQRLIAKVDFKGLPFVFPSKLLKHKCEEGETISEDGITETSALQYIELFEKRLKELRGKSEKIKEKRISEFLWTCAGADKTVLRACPHDYAKYAGIGGTILCTAIMAASTCAFAMTTLFNDLEWYFVAPMVIGIGVFWGLMIYNLDRLITNTMYSDGKTSISFMEIFSALPRILMAICIGIVISTPFELAIFKSEIDEQLVEDKELFVNNYVKRDSVQYMQRIQSVFEDKISGAEDKISKQKTL